MTAPDVSAYQQIEPRSGAEILNDIRTQLSRFMYLPEDIYFDAIVLWIAVTHALPAFDFAPRLTIRSPEKRSGKSRLLDLLECFCFRPLVAANSTTAALFRLIADAAEHPPTIMLDEVDALWGTKRAAEQNEDLRALVNAGHQRGRPTLRCAGPQHEPTEFDTFAMVALAGIGKLPDTITDRAVNVRLQRRPPGVPVEPFRLRLAAELRVLANELHDWLAPLIEELRLARPELPVQDRAADTWEPLIVIADAAGGEWPAQARAAATALVAEDEQDLDEQSAGIRLLAECRRVLNVRTEYGDTHISTDDLLDGLNQSLVQEGAEWKYSAKRLASKLKPYKLESERFRPRSSAKQQRGYSIAKFKAAFATYLPDDEQDPASNGLETHQRVTSSESVTGAAASLPAETPDQ